MKLIISEEEPSVERGYEFVERKGRGHPDTLADGLAEYLSAKYSQYTLKNFGAILHHNFDKVGLLGGSSSVEFGRGRLVKPIRVLLNGRASTSFGKKKIPVEKLLVKWSGEFLKNELPSVSPQRNISFIYALSTQSSPGKTKQNSTASARPFWFEPRGFQDIPELTKLVSNDTSLGVGYAPYSVLENLLLSIEKHFNSDLFRSRNKWIGSDIKILGFRYKKQFDITLCIPQIANFVNSSKQYYANLGKAKKIIFAIGKTLGIEKINLYINTRDNDEKSEYYLTAIGSSIESGDEGVVGRGNRVNGIISPFRPMSMEGVAGKNPVYHIGKLYYVLAHQLAHLIYKKFGIQTSVAIASQSGRDLLDPWIATISVPRSFTSKDQLEKLIRTKVKQLAKITQNIIKGCVSIC